MRMKMRMEERNRGFYNLELAMACYQTVLLLLYLTDGDAIILGG